MTDTPNDDVPAAAPVPRYTIPIPEAAFRTLYLEMVFSPNGAETTATDTPINLLATGTGFFYRANVQDFILTARHNLTGRHWETNEFLSQNYSVAPTHLRVTLREAPPPQGYSTTPGSAAIQIRLKQYLVPLIDAEWKPVWREHPDYGADMDVAAVPFKNPEPDKIQALPWEPQPEDGAASKLWVTQDLSIAGYPFRLTSGPGLPLWIRGTVASEPAFYYAHREKNLPLFLIDARTRSGQSGSPVILFRLPNSPIPSDDGTFRYSLGTYTRLLGVYTGRISKDSDLGFVWHISEAAKTCQMDKPDTKAPTAVEVPPLTRRTDTAPSGDSGSPSA